jgi:uncharacterized protein involved in exopolysaccharide biosynthesis
MDIYGRGEVAPAERASEHLQAISRRWWLVLAAAIVTGVLAYTFSSREEPRYDASAKVLLTRAEPVDLLLHSTAAPSLDPQRDLNTAVALVRLDSVARKVRAQLQLPLSSTELLREVSVETDGTSSVILITARDRSPTSAARIANAFATEYIAGRRRQAESAYATAARLARSRLATLSRADLRGGQGAALRTQLHQLQTAGALQTGAAQLVDPARKPESATTPRPKVAGAVGAFAGLMLGLMAALVGGAVDRRREPIAVFDGPGGHGAVDDTRRRGTRESPIPAPSSAGAPD